MNLFKSLSIARKSETVAQRPPLGRLFYGAFGNGLPEGSAPYSYADSVRSAYESNAVAQRAVRIIAEGVGGAPVSSSSGGLAALVAATTAGQGLLETVAAQLLLHGNAYVQILRGADGRPVELFALRPDRVTITPDARGWPAIFTYRVGDSVEMIDAVGSDGLSQIIHVKGFHPLDDHYGLGCLGAATQAVAIHNAASRWNRALLDNAARPSGALVYEPGDGSSLSPEQFRRLREEMEAAFQGAGNAGRPLLLEGGLSWQAMSLSPAEMDFVGLKAAAAREIALAFGVPPMLLGLPGDNSYANYREANRALWRLTLLPLAGKILDAIAEALRGWWVDARLVVDVDQVTALAEDRERLWGQVTAADFLTRAEKRAMLGLQADAPETEEEATR